MHHQSITFRGRLTKVRAALLAVGARRLRPLRTAAGAALTDFAGAAGEVVVAATAEDDGAVTVATPTLRTPAVAPAGTGLGLGLRPALGDAGAAAVVPRRALLGAGLLPRRTPGVVGLGEDAAATPLRVGVVAPRALVVVIGAGAAGGVGTAGCGGGGACGCGVAPRSDHMGASKSQGPCVARGRGIVVCRRDG